MHGLSLIAMNKLISLFSSNIDASVLVHVGSIGCSGHHNICIDGISLCIPLPLPSTNTLNLPSLSHIENLDFSHAFPPTVLCVRLDARRQPYPWQCAQVLEVYWDGWWFHEQCRYHHGIRGLSCREQIRWYRWKILVFGVELVQPRERFCRVLIDGAFSSKFHILFVISSPSIPLLSIAVHIPFLHYEARSWLEYCRLNTGQRVAGKHNQFQRMRWVQC